MARWHSPLTLPEAEGFRGGRGGGGRGEKGEQVKTAAALKFLTNKKLVGWRA